MDFYYFSLCHVCKQPNPELKKCSSCKVLHYCSRDHQLQDWFKHKALCQSIAKTNKFLSHPKGATPEEFNHYKYSAALLWHCDLGRQLDLFEHQMWMFPKVCNICYTAEVNQVCQSCLSVAYCSKEHESSHKESHKMFCDSLKLCMIINQTIFKNDLPTEWTKLDIDERVQALPKNLKEVMKDMGFQYKFDYSKEHVDFIIVSDFFAPAINMIYALEKSGFIEKRYGKKSKLIVHVVGCDAAEYQICWEVILDFFSHWIINLKSCTFILIGPKVQNEGETVYAFKCKNCVSKKFAASVIAIKNFYHDVVHSIHKPDLVIALNSGLHEFTSGKNIEEIVPDSNMEDILQDTWKESIPKLIHFKGVPVVLTAYTETELKKDVARFEGLRVKFLVKPQHNPYSNLKPIRNWEEGNDPIFYQNSYVTIIAKK